MTILYAIIGIPLMLLYLTNIGDILAKSFRYVYGSLCSCKSDSRDRKNKPQNRSVRYGLHRSVSSVTPSAHQRIPLQPTLSLPTSPMSSLNRPLPGILNQLGYYLIKLKIFIIIIKRLKNFEKFKALRHRVLAIKC